MFEKEVKNSLKELGVPQNVLGYDYLATAIQLVLNNRGVLRGITKMLYPQVAQAHGTTASRVERAIRHAIELSFAGRISYDLLNKVFGKTISAETGKPTNSHYIAAVAEYVLENIEDTSYDIPHVCLPSTQH